MNILFAASEMVPFCKTGGLADVIGALPAELAGLGHDVTVMLPGYSIIDRVKYGFGPHADSLTVPVGHLMKPLALSKTVWNGVNVYLLENEKYFSRESLYGNDKGDYGDNAERFIFYSRGVIEAARFLDLSPDIIHAHDWQAGLIMPYLSTVYKGDKHFKSTATLFTIHNLGYQGNFPVDYLPLTGLPKAVYHWKKMEYWKKLSFMKGGLVYADAVSTVSETYAKEITEEPLGFGMQDILEGRSESLYGIVNGIDTNMWDPSQDGSIPAQYSALKTQGKKVCRKALLQYCGIKAGAGIPVIGMVTRLDDQKGLDILEDGIGRLMSLDFRLVILGTGTLEHHDAMTALAKRYPDRIAVFLKFDNDTARLIYAGADAFLMPSRYEPCGLGQLIAMRYGTLPIVHATGGLKDTVIDLDKKPAKGGGFVFTEYTPEALAGAVSHAVKAYREKGRNRWTAAVKRVMNIDFSWTNSADNYVSLYKRIGKQGKEKS